MRLCFLLLPLVAVVGCGSKSTDQPEAGAGVPLSIGNPVAVNSTDTAASQTRKTPNEAVDKLLAHARTAISEGQPATAIQSLSQAIGIDATDIRLFQQRAAAYLMLGENANAQADLSMAIQFAPENAELRNVRGYFLMTHGAAAAAIPDFQKAIELDPNLAAAYNNLGLVRLAGGKHDEAEKEFTRAIEADADFPDAWNNRGFVRLKLERLDDALTDLQQTVKLNPEYATAWNNCGLVYMKQKNFAAAVDAFSKAVEQAPLDMRWISHRREALLNMERFEDAGKDAQRMRWLNDLSKYTAEAKARATDPELWMARAAHLAKGGEFDAAIQDYSKALQIDRGNTLALNGRAFAWLQIGDHQKAIADCDESLIMQQGDDAFSIRGDAWFALGQFDKAIQDFEAARRFDRIVAEAYRERSKERQAAGRTEEAKQDQQRADEISAGLDGKIELTPSAAIPFPTQ